MDANLLMPAWNHVLRYHSIRFGMHLNADKNRKSPLKINFRLISGVQHLYLYTSERVTPGGQILTLK